MCRECNFAFPSSSLPYAPKISHLRPAADDARRRPRTPVTTPVLFVPQQLSVMCGTHDPTAPVSVAPANGGDANARGGMARLLGLPLFAAVTATFCSAYTAVRNSHESIATVLGYAEDGMRASVELASPVAGRISGALETPLKAVDDAVCVGLDYVEEKIPSVKLPPGQIYANARDSVR